MNEKVDPITVGIIRSHLVSIAREMGVTLRQTAYSNIFNEGSDFSCGVFDSSGRLWAQGEFLPIHLGALQFAVREAIEEVGISSFEEGDAVLLNDPYRGGTHLPDLTAITPIFFSGEIIAFAANRAHHADIGGTVPGSFYSEARENFQEGLRIPPVRFVRRGKIDQDLKEIILNNVRVPREMSGDLEAQFSSNRTAVKRTINLCERYSLQTLQYAAKEICNQSEKRMLSKIKDWPNGTWFAEDYLDNDGINNKPIKIHVALTVADDKLEFDFSGSDKQVTGPVNSVRGMTASATYLAVQAAVDPTIPANDGAYRPINIFAPEGCVLNPKFPAPCTGGNETSHRIVNVIQKAFAELPYGPIVISGDHGSSNNLLISTTSGPNQEPNVFYSYPEGGWGALDKKDGENALFSIVGNCKNMPAEALELSLPIRLLKYELRQDTGGAGRHRGGLGTHRDYEILADSASLSFVADRCIYGANGLDGGKEGGVGAYFVNRGKGSELASPKFVSKGTQISLKKGDIVSQCTAGGGGYGKPEERNDYDIKRDLVLGYISREEAIDTYGINLENIQNTKPS
ncbi:MAG: 5-oxoprolinase [Gammaproteobacteria bacterium]|nr:5-oxoprolinase [Gammaproteobacteria bacterium]